MIAWPSQEDGVQQRIDSEAAEDTAARDVLVERQRDARERIEELQRQLVELQAADVEYGSAIARCDEKIAAVRRGYGKQLTRLQLQQEALEERKRTVELGREELQSQAAELKAAKGLAHAERRKRSAMLNLLREEYHGALELRRQRVREAQQLRRTKVSREGWLARIATVKQRLQPWRDDAAGLHEIVQREGAHGLGLQGERATLRQAISTAEARQPELLEQKQIAISARAFKEAGRLTSELKALTKEGDDAREREVALSALIEANKVALRALSCSAAEVEAKLRTNESEADEQLHAEALLLLRRGRDEVAQAEAAGGDCELLLLRAHQATLMQHAIALHGKLGFGGSVEALLAVGSAEISGAEISGADHDVDTVDGGSSADQHGRDVRGVEAAPHAEGLAKAVDGMDGKLQSVAIAGWEGPAWPDNLVEDSELDEDSEAEECGMGLQEQSGNGEGERVIGVEMAGGEGEEADGEAEEVGRKVLADNKDGCDEDEGAPTADHSDVWEAAEGDERESKQKQEDGRERAREGNGEGGGEKNEEGGVEGDGESGGVREGGELDSDAGTPGEIDGEGDEMRHAEHSGACAREDAGHRTDGAGGALGGGEDRLGSVEMLARGAEEDSGAAGRGEHNGAAVDEPGDDTQAAEERTREEKLRLVARRIELETAIDAACATEDFDEAETLESARQEIIAQLLMLGSTKDGEIEPGVPMEEQGPAV